tara:strand:+ start:940 stop:1173 length:234 start_codon:yes stop_codon:yes gene_type:complete
MPQKTVLHAINMKNPTPLENTDISRIIKAQTHATLEIGTFLTKTPFPIACTKNNHGTKWLTTPNKIHELIPMSISSI